MRVNGWSAKYELGGHFVRNVKNTSVKLASVGLVATALVGGSTSAALAQVPKVTLSIEFQRLATNDQWANWMQQNVKLFEQSHPNVTFNMTANAASNVYLTKITTQMAAGATPDIFEGWTSNRMKPFVAAGRVLDITSFLNANQGLKNEVLKTALPGTTFNGEVYGIPSTLDAEVIFYNKRVFAKYGLKVPTTYNAFLNVIATLKKHHITPITLANQESFNGAIPFQMLEERIGGLQSYQGLVIKNDIPWTSAPVIQAAAKLKQLIQMGAFNTSVDTTSTDQSLAALTTGKAAMYFNGTWEVQPLSGKGMDIGAFNLPGIPGGKGSSRHLIELSNDALYISANSPNKTTAEQFLAFCFTRQRQIAEAKAGELIATNTKLQPGTMVPLADAIHNLEVTATGSPFPFDLPLGTNLGEQFDNATQLLYAGQSAQTVFQNFDQLEKSLTSN